MVADKALSYTQYGPHRADLRFMIKKMAAKEVLSRGQQKLLVSALSLAQGLLLKEQTNKSCLYLIDDLASELDRKRLQLFGTVLQQLKAQVFITSVDLDDVKEVVQAQDTKMFHVEHGAIKP